MADITGDQHVQSEVLEGLATAVNHRRWFVELALPYLGNDPIEIGSGLGDYALEWARHLRRFTATEADPERLIALKERLAGQPNIEVRQMLLPTPTRRPTRPRWRTTCWNTSRTTRGGWPHEPPGAPRRRGRGDRAGIPVRHEPGRRGDRTRAPLHPADSGAGPPDRGCGSSRSHYANALGLLGYYLATSIFHLSPKEGRMVKVYDSVVLPTTKAAEQVVRPPFGQSVFAVARRPA